MEVNLVFAKAIYISERHVQTVLAASLAWARCRVGITSVPPWRHIKGQGRWPGLVHERLLRSSLPLLVPGEVII